MECVPTGDDLGPPSFDRTRPKHREQGVETLLAGRRGGSLRGNELTPQQPTRVIQEMGESVYDNRFALG